jgi:hypothetical protein
MAAIIPSRLNACAREAASATVPATTTPAAMRLITLWVVVTSSIRLWLAAFGED